MYSEWFLDRNCFSQIIEDMMDWISLNYEDPVDYFETHNPTLVEHELHIIDLFLFHSPSDSSLKKFSSLFEFILKYLLVNYSNKKDIIVLLLISESLDLFNKVPKRILYEITMHRGISQQYGIANKFFKKVFELYSHNEEILVNKCAQFLNLLIIDLKNEEDRQFFDEFYDTESFIYDNIHNVYYCKYYSEILNFLFEFRPPPKLFIQNRLFLKFLKLPEALKIQEYKNFIDNLDSETI